MTMMTQLPSARDPIDALLAAPGEGAVLAVIAGVEGPSYRPMGAMMAVFSQTDRAGTLSSGCIENDIALHAMEASAAGRPRLLRYGLGSPFMDIQLPCGGGLDILLVPRPDRAILKRLTAERKARRACALRIDMETGAMALLEDAPTARDGNILTVRFQPALRFLVFGKGPEASTFAALVQSAGYPNLMLSPDAETLDTAAAMGCAVRHIPGPALPADVGVDGRTAIVLFFHDHDWEPPILAAALETPAFYIGSQGSQRARDARLVALAELGVAEDQRARLHGPVGLIPSARDAGTLAVSVLAEVLQKAMATAAVDAKAA